MLLAASCASPPRQAVVPPVGPAPTALPSPESEGYLVVYSAWSNFVDPGSTGHHSRYTLSFDQGGKSRVVINHTDRFDEGPIQLGLAPGSYHVRARSAHFGRVTVPVIIRQDQTTYVYLDGAAHREAASAPSSQSVRLPDGEVVGWSTTVAGTRPP